MSGADFWKQRAPSLGRTALVCSTAFQWSPGGGLRSPCALGMKLGKASSLVFLALCGEGLICKLLGTQKGRCTEVMPILKGGKPQTSKKSLLAPLKKSSPVLLCLHRAQSFERTATGWTWVHQVCIQNDLSKHSSLRQERTSLTSKRAEQYVAEKISSA